MSLLDKMNSLGRMDTETDPSECTTLARADQESVTIKRVRLITEHFTKAISKDPSKKKIAFILKKITEEALEEMDGAPEEILQYYMREATAILYWAASGMVIENMPLPEDFQPDHSLEVEAGESRRELEA